VQTCKIIVLKARENVHEIRSKLFAFPEILEVFVTSRPDALVVVCSGRPRPESWLRALRAVGFEIPARRHPSRPLPTARPGVGAVPDRVSASPRIAVAPHGPAAESREVSGKPPPALSAAGSGA
jgi:hypothetical protein